MVQFKPLSVFLCAMGLLSETLCSLTLKAEAGDKVTIWCQHDLKHPDKIFWFKHTSDLVPLLLGCKRFLTSAPSVDCSFFTESERIVMSVHGKNTSLTITAVNVSDTGLYYCSYSDPMIFSNSTSLQLRGNSGVKTLFPLSGGNQTLSENLESIKGCKATKCDHCKGCVFLAVPLGFVAVILLIVLIFITLKYRKTHTGVEAKDNEFFKKILQKRDDELDYSYTVYYSAD